MTMAIDFGTCNTVLARWDPAARRVETLALDGLAKVYDYRIPGEAQARRSAVIPSLVHYGPGRTLLAGAQVEASGLAADRGTFRWVKVDVLRDNRRARRIHGELIAPRQAGADLIAEVLLAAGGLEGEDLVVTKPVEAFDAYADWLLAAIAQVHRGRVRMLDEATACILGYDGTAREGQVYVVFDFGGGTLDVSVVKTRDLTGAESRLCDVLGRAGEEIGGALVDQWLLQAVQQAHGLSGEDLAAHGIALLRAAEAAKIALSGGAETAELPLPERPAAAVTSRELRRLLETARPDLNGTSLYRLIALTVERALEAAQVKYGTRKSEVRAVFMVGGSSLLLGVAGLVETLFPGCAVHCEDPFEAIARGACRYAGEDISLALVHDYCLRAWDADGRAEVLVPVVPKGTRYPTEGPVTTKYVKAACDGATRLGLVVVERSAMLRPDLVYEMTGGSLQAVGVRERSEVALRPLNPGDREFIHADPPCTVGARRFVAGFGVDAMKRLTLSLKDLEPGNRSFVQTSSGQRLMLPIRDVPIVGL